MLKVTRLNGTDFYLNPDMLITVEATPDTVLSLSINEKLVVKESVEDIVKQFMAYKREIHQGGPKKKNSHKASAL